MNAGASNNELDGRHRRNTNARYKIKLNVFNIATVFLTCVNLFSCKNGSYEFLIEDANSIEIGKEYEFDTYIDLAGAKRISYDASFFGTIQFRIFEDSFRSEKEKFFEYIKPYEIVGPRVNQILDNGNDFYARKAILRIISKSISKPGFLKLRVSF